ncbi:MAG: aminomethyl-transferring glycine dehydrogenase subunit GcvPA [Thiohalomonadales bacterium]
MPYIPHTDAEVEKMLETIGVASIEDLFDEIPASLRATGLTKTPRRRSEMDTGRLMRQAAAKDDNVLCFIGAGAYEHHIPAAVWEITTRGEFYSAYTPYQAEASQGTLQVLYEFQTMMAQITQMEVSNASLYDGASALAEATLMAVRANRKSKSRRILCPMSVHPYYREVVHTITKDQGIKLEFLDFDNTGSTDCHQLSKDPGDITAVIIPMPNFFGVLEEVDQLTDWAHEHGALVIGVVNPTAMAIIKPPGDWGKLGADIACGEGQPLGAPIASGGPYFGFMCCKQKIVRQMPGRIIGKTVDLNGKPGFSLTLQAREQHIRRSKATSNICTNQGLLTTAATLYLALLGPDGLCNVAHHCQRNTSLLATRLTQIKGISRIFSGPHFHEVLLRLPIKPSELIERLAAQHIAAGFDVSTAYPELEHALLVCATETKTEQDIEAFATAIEACL